MTKNPTIIKRTKKLEPMTPIRQVGPQDPLDAGEKMVKFVIFFIK